MKLKAITAGILLIRLWNQTWNGKTRKLYFTNQIWGKEIEIRLSDLEIGISIGIERRFGKKIFLVAILIRFHDWKLWSKANSDLKPRIDVKRKVWITWKIKCFKVACIYFN